MGTLGDLTGGFISGKDATDRWQANKQLRRRREQALEEGEMSLGGRRRVVDAVRQQTGAAPLPEFQSTFGDPFAKKILDWGRNFLGGQEDTPGAARELAAQKQQALPVDTPKRQSGGSAQPRLMANGGPVTSQVGQGQQVKGGGRFPGNQKLSGILFMADGGEVSWEDIQGRSSGEGRGFNYENFKEDMAEAGDWIKQSASEMVEWLSGKAPTMMNMAREGGADMQESLKRAGDLGAEDMGAGAVRALLDVPASVIRAGGATALGAGRDFATAFGFGEGEQAPAPTQTPPPDGALAPPEAVAAGLPQQAPDKPATSGGQGGGQQALPVGPPTPSDAPITEVAPEQMPSMGTDEWTEYRREVVTGLVEQGMNPEEAFRTVDQTVTGMQQRGFIRHMQEAQNLLAAGDQRGAIRALYSGYQYFPDGKNVRFGIQGDKIIGLGLDEKTGERTKSGPMVLDPESIGLLVENLQDPRAFRMWTMDWREFMQDMRRYEEVDKPMAEAQARSLATRSQAALESARYGGAGADYGAADMDRNFKMINEYLNEQQVKGAIPAEWDTRAIARAHGNLRARYPNAPPEELLNVVLERYASTMTGG